MSTETLVDHARETQTSVEELESHLLEAQRDFYDLTLADGFEELCKERDIDVTATDKPEYWRAAADFAYDQASEKRESGENGTRTTLRELLAATPDFVYTQQALDRKRHQFPNHEAYMAHRRQVPELKERASYYNGLIRYVAEQNPDLRASRLIKQLINVTNISIEDKHLKMASVNFAREVVRGAQHELGFGQLLERTGRSFRPATVDEDLHGADYVVDGQHGPIRLDVKASLSSIEAKGTFNKPFAIDDRDGQVTIYSLLSDHQLADRFTVPDRIAEERGKYLETVLEEIENTDSVAYSSGKFRAS